MSPRTAAAVAMATQCNDDRCTAGLTACQGCHGHGMVNPKGRKPYQWGHTGGFPDWAEAHEACNGTGEEPHGCVTLDAITLAAVGRQDEALAVAS